MCDFKVNDQVKIIHKFLFFDINKVYTISQVIRFSEDKNCILYFKENQYCLPSNNVVKINNNPYV